MSEQKEQCQCYDDPAWGSPAFAKEYPICPQFEPSSRNLGYCAHCDYDRACHQPATQGEGEQ